MMTKAKRAKDEPLEIEASSRNVFEDLGLPDPGERLAKAEFARGIRNIAKKKDWTQRRVADVLGIAPAEVSDLMRGKLARYGARGECESPQILNTASSGPASSFVLVDCFNSRVV